MQVLLSVPERRRFHVNPTSCFSFLFNFGITISERRRFFSVEVESDGPKKIGEFLGSHLVIFTVPYGKNETVSGKGVQRHAPGIEPLRVFSLLELKSSPSASPTRHRVHHFEKNMGLITTIF